MYKQSGYNSTYTCDDTCIYTEELGPKPYTHHWLLGCNGMLGDGMPSLPESVGRSTPTGGT